MVTDPSGPTVTAATASPALRTASMARLTLCSVKGRGRVICPPPSFYPEFPAAYRYFNAGHLPRDLVRDVVNESFYRRAHDIRIIRNDDLRAGRIIRFELQPFLCAIAGEQRVDGDLQYVRHDGLAIPLAAALKFSERNQQADAVFQVDDIRPGIIHRERHLQAPPDLIGKTALGFFSLLLKACDVVIVQ
jgi:hypothetical protein